MSKVINPKTGRKITVGGPTWKKLSPRTRQTALDQSEAKESNQAKPESTSLRGLPRDVVMGEIVSRLSPTSRKMASHAKLLPEDMLPKENEKNPVSQAWVWKSIENLDKAMKHKYPKPNMHYNMQFEPDANEYAAVYYGTLPVLQHAKRVYHFFEANRFGYLLMATYIQTLLNVAAGQGKQEVFKWLVQEFVEGLEAAPDSWWQYPVLKQALEFKQYDFFEWMIQTYLMSETQSKSRMTISHPSNIYEILLSAVHITPEKRFELLQWTHRESDNSRNSNDFVVDYWLLYGKTKDDGISIMGNDSMIKGISVINGLNLKTIEWLYRKKIYFNKDFLDYVRTGDVQIIQWAMKKLNRSLERPRVRMELMYSGISGKKDVFEWLLSNGYSINDSEYTEHTTAAAVAGHFELLKWLVDEQQCNLDPLVIRYMTEVGLRVYMAYPIVSFRVFEWVYNRTRPNLREAFSWNYLEYIFKLERKLAMRTVHYVYSKPTIRVMKKNMQETAKILAFKLEKDPGLFRKDKDKERILQIIQKHSHGPRKSSSTKSTSM